MTDVRGDGSQHPDQDPKDLTHDSNPAGIVPVIKPVERIKAFHAGCHHGVELMALHITTDLLQRAMKNAPQVTGRLIKFRASFDIIAEDGLMGMDQRPQAAQETLRPRNGIIVPLKRLIRRRSKHGEKANGVGTIAVNQTLRIDPVIFRFGHRRPASGRQFCAIAHPPGGGGFPLAVLLDLHLIRAHPDTALLSTVMVVSLGQHHPLTEQLCCRLIAADQIEIAHELVPEAEIHQMQHCMLDTADIVIDRQPVISPLIQHALCVWCAVASVIPTRLHERIKGIGFPFCILTAFGAARLAPLGVGLDRRLDAHEGHILGQHHGQIFIMHRHRPAVRTVDHRHRATPVALA